MADVGNIPAEDDDNDPGTDATSSANWTGDRYYAIDYDAGNDGNLGYSDASMAAAGLVAKKTWTALKAIIPRIGAGRGIVVAIKNRAAGANYLTPAAVIDNFDWQGFLGYRRAQLVGTSDFSNSTTDQIRAGFVIATGATGPNGDGSWTCAAGGTVNLFAIGAGALPAASTLEGWRVRFKGNVTAALAERCAGIHTAVAGAGGTISTMDDLNSAPAVGDEFFIEMPGVSFGTVAVVLDGASTPTATTFDFNVQAPGLTLKGIAATANVVNAFIINGPGRLIEVSGCAARGGTTAGLQISGLGILHGSALVTNVSSEAQDIRVGFSIRFSGDFNVQDIGDAQFTRWAGVASSKILRFFRVIDFAMAAGSVYYSPFELRSCGLGLARSGGFPSAISVWGNASDATIRRARAVGTFAFSRTLKGGSCVNFQGVDWGTAQTQPFIRIDSTGAMVFISDNIGTTTAQAIELAQCNRCFVYIAPYSANTYTVAADVNAAGPAPVDAADLAITNVIDQAGNQIFGSANSVVGPCVLLTNSTGSALAVGNIVTCNGSATASILSRANSASNAAGALMVMVTSPANAALGYAVPLGQGAWVLFDAAPSASNLAYLDDGTAGVATTTVPPLSGTNQKRRLGHVTHVSGTMGRIVGSPELLPIISDGLAP